MPSQSSRRGGPSNSDRSLVLEASKKIVFKLPTCSANCDHFTPSNGNFLAILSPARVKTAGFIKASISMSPEIIAQTL